MSDELKVTLAQLNPVVGDLAGNAEKAFTAFEAARAAGADMLALPEMFITG
ncbi:MAG: nitrilase-related carbon-nitrogen hydrolase, partial [Pseudomonadota bacterium]